jgi:hypothetical protein
MDSKGKSGKTGQEGGHHALGMTAPKNPFWFRLGRISGPVPELSKLGLGSSLLIRPWLIDTEDKIPPSLPLQKGGIPLFGKEGLGEILGGARLVNYGLLSKAILWRKPLSGGKGSPQEHDWKPAPAIRRPASLPETPGACPGPLHRRPDRAGLHALFR